MNGLEKVHAGIYSGLINPVPRLAVSFRHMESEGRWTVLHVVTVLYPLFIFFLKYLKQIIYICTPSLHTDTQESFTLLKTQFFNYCKITSVDGDTVCACVSEFVPVLQIYLSLDCNVSIIHLPPPPLKCYHLPSL